MKNLNLDDFALFIEVAAAQSLSKVARTRQVAASHVSRHFARIEAECGLRLAHRTTHSLSLTDDGEMFLEYAQRIASEHAQLRGSLTTRAQVVSGTVRIRVSQLFAQYVVIPRLAELRAKHPSLHVDLHIDDRLVNMAFEGIDIAVRAGVAPLDTVVANGQLRPVLARYTVPQQYPVYAAILAERHRAPKIRATMDFLTICFAAFRPEKIRPALKQ